jgi:hypothetical protein
MVFVLLFICALILMVSRGGTAAFGVGCGTILGAAFIGGVLFLAGLTIFSFALPFITAVLFPLLLVGGFFYIFGRFIRWCNGNREKHG